MSSFYSGSLQQDFLTDGLARILTPWNYLSVSPGPIKQQCSRTQSSSGSTRTLLDTPSPDMLTLASRDLAHTPRFLEADTEHALQSTPFEKHFGVSFSPTWLQPLQEVSPVVRASSSQGAIASSPGDKALLPPKQPLQKAVSCPDHVMYSSDLEENDYTIDATDDDADSEDNDEEEELEIYNELAGIDNIFLRRLHSLGPELSPARSPPCDDHTSPLRSPCKIEPVYINTVSPSTWDDSSVDSEESDNESIEEVSPVQSLTPVQLKDPSRTPDKQCYASPLSPLTPLTPLPCSLDSPISLPTVVRWTTQKRRPDDDLPSMLTSSPKRLRLSLRIPPRATVTLEPARSSSSSSSVVSAAPTPMFTTRTFPPHVEISSRFTLFYRRYPISSYFQPPHLDSPFALLNVRDPGGTYNPPRSVFDLYTPRFVKGKGPGKLGLCPICIEPFERGGENRKNWLAMKFSAFKCYHMQYAHGISAATGRPFAPPSSFQMVARPNAAKKERSQILQGKCQKCRKWVPVEGIKDVESKVKELVWWKHAASCYQDTLVEGEERHYFEHDAVFAVMEEYYVPV